MEIWTSDNRVPPFKASKYLVTNQEFLEFVKDGGYENSKYWTEEGWKWKQFRKQQHPTFWVCQNYCQSGCGADLSTYSHCNLRVIDVNQKSMRDSWIWNGDQNGVVKVDYNRNGFLNHLDGIDRDLDIDLHNGDCIRKCCPYKLRLMFDVVDLPMDWPVEVNYHEAKAFCSWRGPDLRLPTEAEHHVMRGPQVSPTISTTCDIIFQDKVNANMNMTYGSSTPVNMYTPSEAGFCDIFGNVWEWAEDHFNGFEDFKSHHLYADFSTPTFDGRHNIIMGGSWVSTGDEASRFARYAFRRHFFQHLGFRVVKSVGYSVPVRLVGTPVFVLGVGVEDNTVTLPSTVESEAYISTTNSQYLDDDMEFLHQQVLSSFGDLMGVESDAESYKHLLIACKEAIQKFECPVKKALDIMCSVGRFSYELSKDFDEVSAIDHSGRLLDAAIRIQEGKVLNIKGVGELSKVNISLDEIKANIHRVRFQQLTWLPNEIGIFDFIILSQLHRLSNPKAWLVRLWEIIDPKGLLMIKTNAQWDIEALKAILGSKFKLLESHVASETREGLSKCVRSHSSISIWRLKH